MHGRPIVLIIAASDRSGGSSSCVGAAARGWLQGRIRAGVDPTATSEADLGLLRSGRTASRSVSGSAHTKVIRSAEIYLEKEAACTKQ